MSVKKAFGAGFKAGMKYRYAELFGSRQKAIDALVDMHDGDELIYFTVGLHYRNPTTKDVPLTLGEAIDKINNTDGFIDVYRSVANGRLCLDFLDCNDMW